MQVLRIWHRVAILGRVKFGLGGVGFDRMVVGMEVPALKNQIMEGGN